MARKTTKLGNFEALEAKKLMTADTFGLAPPPVEVAPGTAEIEFVEVAGGGAEAEQMCYLKYKLDRAFVKSWSTSGDADDRPTEEVAFYHNKIAFGYAPTSDGGFDAGNYFVADSFSFGVEREMKESGEKGGTEDINIGVGELQECTISKSMDSASLKLAQFAINGNSPGTAEIDFVEVAGESSAAGDTGSDLLIVNNGDGSDFLEAGAGGGPHVKVFDGTSDAAADACFEEYNAV